MNILRTLALVASLAICASAFAANTSSTVTSPSHGGSLVTNDFPVANGKSSVTDSGISATSAPAYSFLGNNTGFTRTPGYARPTCATLADSAGGCSTAVPLPNILANSAFDVWQEATSYTPASSTDTFVADRWKVARLAANYTVSRVSGFNGARYALRIQRNSGTSDLMNMRVGQQILSSVATALAGKTVTASCDVNAGANIGTTAITAYFATGTGNDETYSLATEAFATGSTLTPSTLQTFTAGVASRITWPAVTLPSGISELFFELKTATYFTSAGANDYFDLANCKLEVNGTSTPYVHPSLAESYQEAQFTYRKSFSYPTAPAQNVGTHTGEFLFSAAKAGANTNLATVIFGDLMRGTPTMTFYNPAAANANCRDESTSLDGAAVTTAWVNANGFSITCTGVSGVLVGDAIGFHWTADARI